MYDLIVAGAGMAGLVAAKTAAADGLKVLLIETKRNPAEINRACSGIIKIQLEGFLTFKKPTDLEVKLVEMSVEMEHHRNHFHFHDLGFSLLYTGPISVYHNKLAMSPSGHVIPMYPEKDKLWAIQIDKERFAADLLAAAAQAGAELRTETLALNVENAGDRARLQVQTRSSAETLEAKYVIAADGVSSRLLDGSGLNARRRALGESKVLFYVMEGLETGLPEHLVLDVAIPSVNTYNLVAIALWPGGQYQMHTAAGPELPLPAMLNRMMKHPTYAPWFNKARIVKKLACSRMLRTSLLEPVLGRVYFTGDAPSFVECSIKGAIATGFKAAKCVLKDIGGQDGKADYIHWWQHSFNSNSAQYLAMGRSVPRPVSVLNDAELDDLFHMLGGKTGLITDVIADNIELIRTDRPDIYDKLMTRRAGPPIVSGRPEANDKH